jgi:two-component system, OmpR family, sensor kinase
LKTISLYLPSWYQLIISYKPIASARQITFITHSKIELTKNTNPILLETLIGNLISNAVRHSPEHSEIIITIEKTTLTISNGGTPLKNPEKIFERFNREAKTSQGSGLGLAIVKKICDLAFFEIHYDYSNNYHHFTLTF